MVTPLIFLDIDGVLNSVEWRKSAYPKNTGIVAASMDYWFRSVDPAAVARLNKLIEETGAKVVISSSWRTMLTPHEILHVLKKRGFVGDIADGTPDLSGIGASRWDEIIAYLDDRETEAPFIVLDDDPPMNCDEPERWVRTDYHHGLQDSEIETAQKLLLS